MLPENFQRKMKINKHVLFKKNTILLVKYGRRKYSIQYSTSVCARPIMQGTSTLLPTSLGSRRLRTVIVHPRHFGCAPPHGTGTTYLLQRIANHQINLRYRTPCKIQSNRYVRVAEPSVGGSHETGQIACDLRPFGSQRINFHLGASRFEFLTGVKRKSCLFSGVIKYNLLGRGFR